MEIKQVGLNTLQVTFNLKEKNDFYKFIDINKEAFNIDIIYINNGYGCLLTTKKIIDIL